MIKFVYFDIGDVMVDCSRYFERVCRDCKIDFKNLLSFYVQHKFDLITGKLKTEKFWEECIDNFGLNGAENYNLVKSWVSDYVPVKPIKGLVFELENRVDVGVISNINSGMWEEMIHVGLVPNIRYKKVLLSCNLGVKKPEKEIYQTAQNVSEVKPEEILFVDNQEKNLVLPNKLGWRTFLFDITQPDIGVTKITKMLSMIESSR